MALFARKCRKIDRNSLLLTALWYFAALIPEYLFVFCENLLKKNDCSVILSATKQEHLFHKRIVNAERNVEYENLLQKYVDVFHGLSSYRLAHYRIECN